MPEVDSDHTCLAVMTIDFALKNYWYHRQVFLKEYKYIEKKVIRHGANQTMLSLAKKKLV